MQAAAITFVSVVIAGVIGYEFGKRREIWVRRLNSRQDFFQEVSALVGYLRTGLKPPEAFIWDRLAGAAKAVHDAKYLSIADDEVALMEHVMFEVARAATEEDAEGVVAIARQIETFVPSRPPLERRK